MTYCHMCVPVLFLFVLKWSFSCSCLVCCPHLVTRIRCTCFVNYLMYLSPVSPWVLRLLLYVILTPDVSVTACIPYLFWFIKEYSLEFTPRLLSPRMAIVAHSGFNRNYIKLYPPEDIVGFPITHRLYIHFIYFCILICSVGTACWKKNCHNGSNNWPDFHNHI